MRLDGLRIKGFGPFKDELSIDFARDYGDAKVIAITGENGAGKTTMLELALPGAMFRSTPTRGTLTELATSRDAMLEARVVNGKPWTLRHLVDGISKKSEALVLDGDGQPVVESGKVTHFDQWAAKHLPAPEVLFTSIFGAQGADGFVGMKPGERKAVLLRTLGVERYEGLAERARERAKQQKTKIETLEARIGDERARHGGDAGPALQAAVDEQNVLEQQLAAARSELASAEVEATKSVEARRIAAEATSKRAQLAASIANARESVADLEKRLTNCRSEVADAEKIRAAAGQLTALDEVIAERRVDLTTREGQLAAAEAELSAAREQLASVRREKRDSEESVARLTERLAEEAKVAAAVTALPERRLAVETARKAVAILEDERQALADRRQAGADDRISALRHGLTLVTELSDDADAQAATVIAADHLDLDNEVVRLAAEAPARQAAAVKALSEGKAGLLELERGLTALERLAARAPEFASIRVDLATTKAAGAAAADRETAADARAKAAHDACEPVRAAIQRARAELAAKQAEREPASALAGRAERLAKAEVMLVEREKQLANARDELAHFEQQHSATPEPVTPPPAPDVASYRRDVENAERALREAAAAVAVASQRCDQERASQERLAELTAQRAGLDDELADWNRIAADLGRDGLQAQLIDAAIPELNHVANELLHEAFGPRFTIDVRTQALDSKGKRLLETLDVVVIDTEGGREALAETFSGGERVIIQEALSLALTVIACRQTGVEQPTLIRDESGAALSVGKAPQWVAMLRRAVDLIGAKQCLFVSHTPATWDLADARIHLGGTEAS